MREPIDPSWLRMTDDPVRQFNWLIFIPLVVTVIVVSLFFVVVNWGNDHTGPRVVPTTYGPPPASSPVRIER